LSINKEVEKAKTAVKALYELSEAKQDASKALKNTCIVGESTEKLWRQGNKSKLFEIGMTSVAIPEPTQISVIIGAGLIAAGAVQRGIQSRTMFLEDTQKNFTDMLKEIRETKYTLQL
jgi:hypothetical protein